MNNTFSSHWNSLREAKNIYTKEKKKLSAHSIQQLPLREKFSGFLVNSSDSVLLYRFSISTYSGESGRTTRFFIRWLPGTF